MQGLEEPSQEKSEYRFVKRKTLLKTPSNMDPKLAALLHLDTSRENMANPHSGPCDLNCAECYEYYLYISDKLTRGDMVLREMSREMDILKEEIRALEIEKRRLKEESKALAATNSKLKSRIDEDGKIRKPDRVMKHVKSERSDSSHSYRH